MANFKSPQLINFDSDAEPDPASQNDADPLGSGSGTLDLAHKTAKKVKSTGPPFYTFAIRKTSWEQSA